MTARKSTVDRIVERGKELYRRIRWYAWRMRHGAAPESIDGKVWLHLGCGHIDAPGFINIDLQPLENIHYLRDITSPKVWRPGCADLIYVSHALEHVPSRAVSEVLENWHRVLKPGGVLRISVPDFDKLQEVYVRSGKDISLVEEAIVGGQTSRYDYHYTLFDRKKLESMLYQAGFDKVSSWCPDKWPEYTWTDWASYKVEAGGRDEAISLNIEAIK